MKKETVSRLSQIGVYGFNKVEPVILAALVTEDPLLLIGETGTGKTYLLNSLSEVLGLEHRHYNASLISFDDLVGFPYPDAANEGVKFLETPATVWGAESVLIDEISRCKPEHQNRLFSLIHERRLQGIALKKLRYRWAAMNPCNSDQTSYEDYSGSEPLDPALADRFSLFVKAVDWGNLSDGEKKSVADPKGEGAVSDDSGCLKQEVLEWREKFTHQVLACPADILAYVRLVVTLFNSAKIRVSPRRARMLSRSLLAAVIVTGKVDSALFLQILTCSLPQVTWGQEVKQEKIATIHKAAWKTLKENTDNAWVLKFNLTESLSEKLRILVDECPNPDAGTQAVEQLISNQPIEKVLAFAFATFSAASRNKLPIGAEAIHDLGKEAMPIFLVDGKITWQERLSQSKTKHPEFVRYSQAMKGLFGTRKQRAKQFFSYCLVNGVNVEEPELLEEEIDRCIKIIKELK